MKKASFLFSAVVRLGRALGKLSAMLVAASGLCLKAAAMNSILPGTAFIPDSQPDVYDYKGKKRVLSTGRATSG